MSSYPTNIRSVIEQITSQTVPPTLAHATPKRHSSTQRQRCSTVQWRSSSREGLLLTCSDLDAVCHISGLQIELQRWAFMHDGEDAVPRTSAASSSSPRSSSVLALYIKIQAA
ncbi:hypothetical protein BD310DRAFT_820872 [Dichomitus squalens]|uniref:Uncharacterized protein n=1 Tax=Dichomitus squalens TaxID=114155 RepID=A0A4Q9PTM5_9APHY|nr:hypothetical protein BD310DRAFT_820872 [Dichomitus squalens]